MKNLAILFLAAGVANAQEARFEWPAGGDIAPSAWVELHEPRDHPTAHAEVTFENRSTHKSNDHLFLTLGATTVEIILDWNFGGTTAERITVIPPAGYIAIPPEITVNEDQTGVVAIFGATS